MNQKNAKWKSIGMIMAITALLLAFFSAFHPIYATNDDVFLDMLSSGAMTGQPEWRLLHVGIITSTVLHGLYRLLPVVNWYGCYLLFCISFTVACFLWAVVEQSRAQRSRIIRGVKIGFVLLLVLAAVFHHGIILQYTTVSGFLAAGAVGILFLQGSCVAVYVLLAMGISLRANACLMLLPVMGLYFLFHLKKWKQGLLMLAVILVPMVLGHVAYLDSAWADFKTYNSNRETVYDYGGYPAYEKHLDFYEVLGLNETEYEAASHRYQLFLTEELDKDAMVSIADIAQADRAQERGAGLGKLPQMLHLYVERHLSYTDRPLNLMVYGLWLLALVGFFLTKRESRKSYLMDLLTILAGALVMWGYLTYVDRMPARVTQIIYLMELFGLLGILVRNTLPKMSLVVILLACYVAFTYGRQDVAANQSRLATASELDELQGYMAGHEGFYLLDMNSFSDFTKGPWQTSKLQSGDTPFFYMGSWMVKSPWYAEKMKRLGTDVATLEKSAYYVFRDTDQTSADYLQSYIKADLGEGFTLKLVDRVACEDGMNFLIYGVTESKSN